MTEHRHEDAAADVRRLLQDWADATRGGRRDAILANHRPDARIYDVLPPLQHLGTQAYRDTWDSWQPQTTGEEVFRFTELNVDAGADTAFGWGLIECGGRLADGRRFEDLVRATFCLRKREGGWQVVHQHISKPVGG